MTICNKPVFFSLNSLLSVCTSISIMAQLANVTHLSSVGDLFIVKKDRLVVRQTVDMSDVSSVGVSLASYSPSPPESLSLHSSPGLSTANFADAATQTDDFDPVLSDPRYLELLERVQRQEVMMGNLRIEIHDRQQTIVRLMRTRPYGPM